MPTLDPSTTAITTPPSNTPFRYPGHYHFPPFFNLQPNPTTRAAQLTTWSTLILSYCATHRIFRITPSDAIFENTTLRRRLSPDDAKDILSWMAERGRIEWVDAAATSTANNVGAHAKGKEEAWVWWKTPEDWAASVSAWVERTGQKGSVLTFYELVEGEATTREEFFGLPSEMLAKAMGVLVGRGKASLFGEDENMGVKIY